ncbi:T9SS type A sorting domain-containing protein [Phaeodactylibacter luteus]|uniref:T9SS type A sorting domain-containing protein n=1 Tax=Phaeodactylibacter luteus TaxID=1564516 RepID=A0A5C6RRF8_9BACT|nr:T9SS type A sorting domain-containing protein [Phaeodactylibacter luteus]TXB64868.1 T9SS type A sorting domain-containing protein [Phaeodactylibacter luteus]
MKKLIFTLLPAALLSFSAQAQQIDTVFYEGFDGGIPSTWTIGPGTPEGAVWQWADDAQANDALVDGEVVNALFWGQNPAIGSASAANGAAMYNSDVYDGGGVGVGQGPFPGTHSGTLTSPSIDCSGFETLYLTFHQYARANANAVSTILEVSVDSGMTWTGFPINPEVVGNGSTPSTDLEIVDISDVAGGEPNVQIRFTWNGRYYFWLIDDVQIITPPAQELALGDFFYSPASYATPESQIATDTFGFEADISNIGSAVATNVVLKASILELLGNNQTNLIYSDSLVIAEFPPFTRDSTVQLENTFAPELPQGQYRLLYELYSQDGTDFNPGDNSGQETFEVSEFLFSKENGPESGTRTGDGSDYQFGNYYQMSPLSGDNFVVSTASFSGVKNASDGPIAGEQVTLILYRVADDVAPDFNNFDTDLESTSLEAIGFAIYTFEDGDGGELITIELTDLDGNKINLEPGVRYFLVGEWAGDSADVFAGTNDNINYFQISTVVRTSQWFLGGFGPETTSVMRLGIELANTADEVALPEAAMSIFPNPVAAGNELNVQVDLEEASPAMLIVAGIDGKVLKVQEYPNGVQQETLKVSTAGLAAGMYLVRLSTDNGTKTMKFTVAK